MQLDLEVAANKKLNKLAWCYLTLSLEGDALQELDLFTTKNAYEVWQHLKVKYKPKEEKGNYCYIDLWQEDFEEDREEVEKKECQGVESLVGNDKENANREENEEAKKGEQEFFEDLLKDDADDSIWEEDEENNKAKEFPMEKRVNEDEEINGEKDFDKIQEHETTELKEEEEEEKNTKNEEDKNECLTWEEQSQQEDFREEEKCSIKEEEIVFWIDMEEVQDKKHDYWSEEYWLWEEDWEVDVKNEEENLFWKEYWNEKDDKRKENCLEREEENKEESLKNDEISLVGGKKQMKILKKRRNL